MRPPSLSYRRLLCRTLTLAAAFASALSLPTAAVAGNAVFIVPDGATVFDIPAADLVGSVPGASGNVLTTTATERGSLFNLGTIFQYAPSANFFDRGSDSFHFEVATGGGNVWGTAFLIAGMGGDSSIFLPLDDPAVELADLPFSNGGQMSVNQTNPIRGAYDFGINLDPTSTDTLSTSAETFGEPNDGPSGAAHSGRIDPGTSDHTMPGGELVIALGLDDNSQELARLLLVDGPTGTEIAGEVLSNTTGAFSRTQSVPISAGQHWELQSWGATASGSRDGGALLIIDGVSQQLMGGLATPSRELAEWRFGAVSNSGFGGFFQLDDLEVKRATRFPRIQPVFADNFEGLAPVWSGGSCGTTPQPTASIGVLTVAIDSVAVDCFRSRTFTEPQRQHRVRLTVDLEDAILAPLDSIFLVVGRRTVAPPNQLQFVVRRTGGGILQMRAKALLDNLSFVQLPWVNLPDASEREVELHWWAAEPGSSDGGLRLTIDNVLVGEALGLANSTMTVDELRLGAMGVDSGSFGHVTFGGIEAWQ